MFAGIVVSRQRNGSWSAPCAAACYGVGWGLQLGGELTDVLLVLKTEEAVRAFAAGQTLGLGGSAGIAVGPLGRSAEASVRVGGLAARGSVVGYSCSKGAFIGVSVDGSLTCARDAVNKKFYGYAVSAKQLLVDCSVPQPPAAAILYESLDALVERWENRGLLMHTKDAVAAITAAAEWHPPADAAAAACSSSSSSKAVNAAAKQQQPQPAQPITSSSFHRADQHQRRSYADQDDDDIFTAAETMFEPTASAPPAPASMLHAYSSSRTSSINHAVHYPPLATAASAADIDDLPSAPTTVVHRAPQYEDDEEEPQYVLEW